MAKTGKKRSQRNNLAFRISNTIVTSSSICLCDHAKTATKCKATKCEYCIPLFPPPNLSDRAGSHHHRTDTATSVHTASTYNANANYQTGRYRCAIAFNSSLYAWFIFSNCIKDPRVFFFRNRLESHLETPARGLGCRAPQWWKRGFTHSYSNCSLFARIPLKTLKYVILHFLPHFKI